MPVRCDNDGSRLIKRGFFRGNDVLLRRALNLECLRKRPFQHLNLSIENTCLLVPFFPSVFLLAFSSFPFNSLLGRESASLNGTANFRGFPGDSPLAF